MKHAWIENGTIRDIAQGVPEEIYHQDIAVHYSEIVPETAENGDFWDGVKLTKREIIVTTEPVTARITEVTPVEFKLRFTSAERIAIRALRSTDSAIDDFMNIIDDPRLSVVHLDLTDTIEAVTYVINAVKTNLAYTQAQADARIVEIL